MKRIMAVLIIGSLLYFCGLARAESADELHEIYMYAYKHRIDRISHVPYVVRIQSPTNYCTGVVVKKGFVVTASHCFTTMDASGIADFQDGRHVKFSVVYKTISGSLGDFAILKLDTGDVAPAPLSTIIPPNAETIFHVGHPFGYRDQIITPGIMVKESPIEIAATAVPGESGGPVLDSQMRVFAIIQATFVPPLVSWAVPIAPAMKVISDLSR